MDRKIGKKMLSDVTVNRGNAAVKNLLLGPSGAMTYNMARAAGRSRGESAVRAVLDLNLGSYVESSIQVGARNLVGGAKLGADSQGVSLNENHLRAASGIASIAGRGLSDAAGAKIRDSGMELSLQQRAIRKHYINDDWDENNRRQEQREKEKRKKRG